MLNIKTENYSIDSKHLVFVSPKLDVVRSPWDVQNNWTLSPCVIKQTSIFRYVVFVAYEAFSSADPDVAPEQSLAVVNSLSSDVYIFIYTHDLVPGDRFPIEAFFSRAQITTLSHCDRDVLARSREVIKQ